MNVMRIFGLSVGELRVHVMSCYEIRIGLAWGRSALSSVVSDAISMKPANTRFKLTGIYLGEMYYYIIAEDYSSGL